MGKGNTKNAKKYALYSSYIMVAHLLITGVPIFLLRENIANNFSNSEKVQEQLLRIIPYSLGVYCLDSI